MSKAPRMHAVNIRLKQTGFDNTCGLLNILALHVQYGIQAFAKSASRVR